MFDYRALYEIELSVSVDFLRVVQFENFPVSHKRSPKCKQTLHFQCFMCNIFLFKKRIKIGQCHALGYLRLCSKYETREFAQFD